jgi:hypothetical protein
MELSIAIADRNRALWSTRIERDAQRERDDVDEDDHDNDDIVRV